MENENRKTAAKAGQAQPVKPYPGTESPAVSSPDGRVPEEAEALRAIRESEARNGIRTVAAEPGYAEAVKACVPSMLNPVGTVHGGWLYTLADATGGIAANAYGRMVVTLDSSFHYLRTAHNCTLLHAYASEIKHGRRAMVFNVSVRDQDGTELAMGIFTYMPFDVRLKEDRGDRRK